MNTENKELKVRLCTVVTLVSTFKRKCEKEKPGDENQGMGQKPEADKNGKRQEPRDGNQEKKTRLGNKNQELLEKGRR